MRKTLVAAGCMFVAGCMVDLNNGSTTSDPVVGKTFNFAGYFDEPDELIVLEILKEPEFHPDHDYNWVAFGAARTGTDPLHVNSDKPLYAWQVNATPVPPNASDTVKKRWPEGGVARVRAVHLASDGTRDLLETFDAVNRDCLNQRYAAGDDWQTIGTTCAGLGDKNALLVSTSTLPTTHVPFLSDKGSSTHAFTYYQFAYADAPDNLNAFRSRFGFDSNPDQVVTAKYFNDADLGLGRDMNCKSFPSTFGLGVACYVRNYSGYSGVNAFQNQLAEKSPAEVLDAMIVPPHQLPFATVAMVFVPPAGQPNSVRFMVYGADGELTDNAQLDYAGDNTTIPNNCLSCHGINATVQNGLVVDGKAQFLPFDPFSYKFAGQSPYRLPDQQDAFRRLNILVRLTSPPPATFELIDGLYAPNAIGDSGAVATNTFIPAAWKPNNSLDGQALYNGVIKPYCRTCHASATTDTLDFNSYSDVKNRADEIRSVVCGTKKMPHAERVQHRFWRSGARAYVLTGLGAAGGDPLAGCKP